ncbi:MAG: VOC family protein [Bacteroidota bacterium]
MANSIEPTLGNGKICYLEIPAVDIAASVSFYKTVFCWHIRQRENGEIAFDDGVGQVSGTWITGRKASPQLGILIYIMVDDINAIIEKINENGGKMVQPVGMDAPEITARFSDPAGNILGIFQQ